MPPARTRWRHALRSRRVAVLLALAAVGWAGHPSPAQAALSASAARYFALGYLWGDGHAVGDGWRFLSCEQGSADRFAAAAAVLGAAVERSRARPVCGRQHAKMYAVLARHLDLDVNQPGMPPALEQADVTETKEFLTGVIEGEGNPGTGMVLDDPSATRAKVMTALMNRTPVSAQLWHNGTNTYFRVYAVRADWPKLRDWPWASCARVPGHYC